MATTGSVKKGTDASGTPIATHTISEDAETKHIQRISLSDVDGADLTATATGGAPSSVTVDTTTNGVQLLAASSTRVGFVIHNAGTVDMYIGFSATGLTTANGIRIFPGGSYQLTGVGMYRGIVHGIVASGTTDARIQAWG